MPAIEEELRQIGRHIAHWTAEVGEANKNGFYDINKVSEGLVLRLLNLVFDYNLRDMNEEKKNFPGIDLGENGRVAIQVTSRVDLFKYRRDIQTFNRNNYVKSFPEGIRFFVINSSTRRRKVKLNLQNFDDDHGVFYAQDLLRMITTIYYEDQPRYRQIKVLLEQEFPLRPQGLETSNDTFQFKPTGTVPTIRTELIILEVDKIREDCYASGNDWYNKKPIFQKLNRFLDHSNEHVAERILNLIDEICDLRGEEDPDDKASTIRTMLINYLPSAMGNGNEMGIANAKVCCHIGHDLVYDSLIYLNDFRIATYGLWIMKYVYRLARKKGIATIERNVHSEYDYLEMQLKRPERNDLGNAQQLVAIFRADLDTPGMLLPEMPNELLCLV